MRHVQWNEDGKFLNRTHHTPISSWCSTLRGKSGAQSDWLVITLVLRSALLCCRTCGRNACGRLCTNTGKCEDRIRWTSTCTRSLMHASDYNDEVSSGSLKGECCSLVTRCESLQVVMSCCAEQKAEEEGGWIGDDGEWRNGRKKKAQPIHGKWSI